MALGKRYKTAPGAGTLAALILVLVFGSPWYRDWVDDNITTNPETALNWFLRLIDWPLWLVNSDDSLREIWVNDIKAILVVVLTALFLFMLPGSQLARARGTLSQFFAGWASYIFAGCFAALLTTLFRVDPSLLQAFQSAGEGATYGFFTGWIIGLATLGGRRGTRS